MKYICLGYMEPGKFEGMTEDEQHAVLDECFEHNDHLRATGHLVAEVSVQAQSQPEVYKHSRRIGRTFAASFTISNSRTLRRWRVRRCNESQPRMRIEKEVHGWPPLPCWCSLLFVHPLNPTHS